MARRPRTREQHIAVFGESGSGKTVLVSSFFGPTQEKSYANDLWDLVADDAGQGNRLYQNYLGMRDRGTAPATTRFVTTRYSFSVKLKGGDNAAVRRRPFDALRLVWHDYPGQWFTETPSSAEESGRRAETFRALLRSDVALLLVDGQRLLDFQGEEERYLKSLLTNFRQTVLRLKDDLLADEPVLVEFPRIWVLALSKADLFPDWDIYAFRDLVIEKAAGHLDDLRLTLRDLVDTPDAMSVGEDFVRLSSAKFAIPVPGAEAAEIDVTQRVGLDLILPVASMLPLERRVQWSERVEIPRRVLDTLADGAEQLAVVLATGWLDDFLSRLPNAGPLLRLIGVSLLTEAARLTSEQLKVLNEKARAEHDYLTATITQLKRDLENGVAGSLLILSRK